MAPPLATTVLQGVRCDPRHCGRHGTPFELQHQPQRGHCIIDVPAACCELQPIGNVTPCFLLAAVGRQTAKQSANVAQRSQRCDGRDL
jgi:hypothetical protein